MNTSKHSRVNRRQFIRQTGLAAGALGLGWASNWKPNNADRSGSLQIVVNPQDPVAAAPPVQWAIGQLRDELSNRGITSRVVPHIEAGSDICIMVASNKSPQWPELAGSAGVHLPVTAESLALASAELEGHRAILAAGSDARGLVYSTMDLVDRILCGTNPLDGLVLKKPVVEQPANTIRSVGRLFTSDIEDKPWFYDKAFWQRYLTFLATQRFNRFNLTLGLGYDFTRELLDTYFYFAYPFLVAPAGYNVRAVPLPDEERARNLEMLRFISEETVRRGLQFQLGVWTHAYRWTDSPRVNYTIEGLSPETHGPYCRDALTALLTACPSISGVTMRTHGESGVPERSYDFWKTVFEGIVRCGRKVEIDLHAKGLDQKTIDSALATGLPVTISPKYWAEHMGLPYMQGAIRPQEMPPPDAQQNGFFANSSGSRSFLRYGYGDLMREDRRYSILHRIWPGTQRLLLWGSPEMARGYGRASSFCGSNGVELFEPLSFKGQKGSGLPGGRDAYADAALKPVGDDFEKYAYTYRVWGRCLYNPETDADGWQRELQKEFGPGAADAEMSLEAAGQILPLVTTAHCPSAAKNNYWPEMYLNMSFIDSGKPLPFDDTPNPKRFGTVSSLDPEFFWRIEDFADELLKGTPGAKCSPVWVADRLELFAQQTETHLANVMRRAPDSESVAVRRFTIDATIQAGLGRFFAEKFRAAVWFALYERTEVSALLGRALSAYRSARIAWSGLASTAKGVYVADVTFGIDKQLRGHWEDRLAAIDDDIADVEKSPTSGHKAQHAPVDPKILAYAISAAQRKDQSPSHPEIIHTPLQTFQRGKALRLAISCESGGQAPRITSAQLRYRRVNQAETWQAQKMELKDGSLSIFTAEIPGSYSDSPFPLQYHFEVHANDGDAWLCPGLDLTYHRQPYFVVRQELHAAP